MEQHHRAALVVSCALLVPAGAQGDPQTKGFFAAFDEEVTCRVHTPQHKHLTILPEQQDVQPEGAKGKSWRYMCEHLELYQGQGPAQGHFDPEQQYPGIGECPQVVSWPRCLTPEQLAQLPNRDPVDQGWRYPLVADEAATRTYQDTELDWWSICATADRSKIVSDPSRKNCDDASGLHLQEVGRCQASAHYYERMCTSGCPGNPVQHARIFYSFVRTHPDCDGQQEGCYHDPLSAVLSCKQRCRRYFGNVGFNRTFDGEGDANGEFLDRWDEHWAPANCEPNCPPGVPNYNQFGLDTFVIIDTGDNIGPPNHYDFKTPLEICLGNCGPPDPYAPAHINNADGSPTAKPCGRECCLAGADPAKFCTCGAGCGDPVFDIPATCDPATEFCCNPRSDCCVGASCVPGTQCCEAKPPWVSSTDASLWRPADKTNHWTWTTYFRHGTGRDPHVFSLWLRTYGVAGDKPYAPVSECSTITNWYCDQAITTAPDITKHRTECKRENLLPTVDLDNDGIEEGIIPLNLLAQADTNATEAWAVAEMLNTLDKKQGFCASFGRAVPFCRDDCITQGNVGADSLDHLCGENLPGAAQSSCKTEDGLCHCPDANGPACLDTCGDGTQILGAEDCDNNDILDGDCCSGVCVFDLSGMACEVDGNGCTVGTCNSTGTCTETCDVGACCAEPGCGLVCQQNGTACECM